MKLEGIEIINKKNLVLQKIDIKGVLFDMDGVILDTEILYSHFWQEAANVLGYPMTRQQALGMRSLNKFFGTERIKSYFGPDASYTDIRNKRIELMDAFVEKEGVSEKVGIRELLAYLKEKGIKTSIATSSPMERAMKYLASVKLDDAFDQIITGNMVERGKPEPDIYVYAAKELGVPVENCLVIEDSPSGSIAGNRAGCVTVMIPDQDQPDEETKEVLFAKVDSLELIIDLLESLGK